MAVEVRVRVCQVMIPSFTLAELSKLLNAKILGDGQCRITGIAPIQEAGEGDITFVTDRNFVKFLSETKASAVLSTEDWIEKTNLPLLIVENVKFSLVHLLNIFFPPITIKPGIHQTAIIGNNCCIAETAFIGPNCVIGNDVKIDEYTRIDAGCIIEEKVEIGSNCQLHAKVVIHKSVKIGNHVNLHSGVVIGSEGFGFVFAEGKWTKIPQISSVILGNDVEVGANTTIDCGTLTPTVIGNGVKIDNHVQVGHNVSIGEHTIIAGCTGIAGSTKIGSYCIIGGGACISDHLTIVDRVVIGGMGAVGQSINEPGVYSSGTPVLKNKEWRRNMLHFQHLDQLVKRIRQLERKSNGADGH